MVDKIGEVLEKVGVRDLPYQLSRISNTGNIDNIAITSDLNEGLFREFEEIIHSNYSENKLIGVYADPAYEELIEKSDKIHEDTVTFFTYENGAASTQMTDLLADAFNEKSLIIASKEYLEDIRQNVETELKNQNDEFIGLYN